MSTEHLFAGNQRMPEQISPAEMSSSPLAEYVLAQMPADLTAVRAGVLSYEDLSAKQQGILDELTPTIAGITDEHAARVTQLDLAFMLGGYLPLEEESFRHTPPQLLGLLDQQADRFGLPRRMDYELIIDVNSTEYERHGHIRTYLDGAAALHERDFYVGHHECEPFVKSSAYQLRSIVEQPDRVDGDRVIASALSGMRAFRDYMAAYLKLSTEVFGTMRPYLATYPDGIRNASGAFMPSVQLLELALYPPTDSQEVYIDESMPYFPGWARGIIDDWRNQSKQGANVVALVESGALKLGDDGREALGGLLEEFYQFRSTHMAAARKQIPEAFEDDDVPVGKNQILAYGEPDILHGGTPGTAGFNIVRVLAGAASRTLRTRNDMENR